MAQRKFIKSVLGLSALFAALAVNAQVIQENAAKPGNSGDWNSGNLQNQQPISQPVPPNQPVAPRDGAYGQTGSSTMGATATGKPPVASPQPAMDQATAQPAMAAAPMTGTLNSTDTQILKDMAMANMAEVEMAKLAQSKSSAEGVKSFAQQMIDDHGKALTDVQQLAQSKGVTLPTSLDAMHQKELDRLSAMSGAAFDRAYMNKAGVADHRKVHAALARFEKRATDADVKALASKMMPPVEQHLSSARQQMGGMGGKTKSGKSMHHRHHKAAKSADHKMSEMGEKPAEKPTDKPAGY